MLLIRGQREHNLPPQLTRFIGGGQKIADIARLLLVSRLVTLTGVGGVGKTRIAVQVATNALEKYTDGVRFVDLASVSDPVLIAKAVPSALDLSKQVGSPGFRSIADALAKEHGKKPSAVLTGRKVDARNDATARRFESRVPHRGSGVGSGR